MKLPEIITAALLGALIAATDFIRLAAAAVWPLLVFMLEQN